MGYTRAAQPQRQNQYGIMTSAQRQRIKELFDAAFELAPSDQARLLAEACADDPAVRAEVEQLLQRHRESPEYLEAQPINALLELPEEPALTGLQPGREIGPYRLLRELGRGGMAAVYLAERADGVHAQPVAIKFVWPGGGRAMVQRFRREREILARLNHPNIARLLDGGTTEEGWHYLVMEYVEGQTITAYCRAHKLGITARLELFRTVCAAVQYAHQNLVIHRDLKPSNILVTPASDGKAGTAKLLDFGIAKLLDPGLAEGEPSTLTRGGLLPLTPLYASPEQVRNQPITTASDVYSLGVLLYELLTGCKPYRTESAFPPDQMRAVLEEEPERPSSKAKSEAGSRKLEEIQATHSLANSEFRIPSSQLQGDLDNIVLKALQKEVRLRYATVEQLSDDLQRHLVGEPVPARPATWRYRAGKYVGRNKPFVAAASLLMLVLVAITGVTAWQLRTSRAREREQRYALYAADMRQAGADWGEGNLVQMDELLERHRPGNGIDDEWRGFEWFALWKLLHVEERSISFPIWFSGPCLTPDGKTVLFGQSETIGMWDAVSGRYIGEFAKIEGGIQRLTLSTDGTKLVDCSKSFRTN